MNDIQCFKIKRGTNYDKAVKEHFLQLPKWKNVSTKVSELLGEEITKLGFVTDDLYVDLSELTKEENKRLFTKDGKLRGNLKRAKQIRLDYQDIIKEEGLSEYKDLSRINFVYGFIRTRGQELESYRTSEDDIYYKANFDLEKRAKGLVEPISHIEYEEKYLEELKKQDEVSA